MHDSPDSFHINDQTNIPYYSPYYSNSIIRVHRKQNSQVYLDLDLDLALDLDLD